MKVAATPCDVHCLHVSSGVDTTNGIDVTTFGMPRIAVRSCALGRRTNGGGRRVIAAAVAGVLVNSCRGQSSFF